MDPTIIYCPLSTIPANPIMAQQTPLGANINQVSMYKRFLLASLLLCQPSSNVFHPQETLSTFYSLPHWMDWPSPFYCARCALYKQKKQATLYPIRVYPICTWRECGILRPDAGKWSMFKWWRKRWKFRVLWRVWFGAHESKRVVVVSFRVGSNGCKYWNVGHSKNDETIRFNETVWESDVGMRFEGVIYVEGHFEGFWDHSDFNVSRAAGGWWPSRRRTRPPRQFDNHLAVLGCV